MPTIPVPTDLIYAVELPATLLQTWLLLRALAGENTHTTSCSMYELSQLTGKSRATLYSHLEKLRIHGFLDWSRCGKNRFTVAFEAPAAAGEPEISSDMDAAHRASELPDDFSPDVSICPDDACQMSEPPDTIQPVLSTRPDEPPKMSDEMDDSGQNRASKSLLLNSPNINNLSQPLEEEKEPIQTPGNLKARRTPAAGAASRRKPAAAADAVRVYETLAGRRPTPPQREEIYARVSDLDLWRAVVEHWLMHAWNPRNLQGLLNSYSQGGEAACRVCHSAALRHPVAAAGLDDLIAAARRREADDARLSRDSCSPN